MTFTVEIPLIGAMFLEVSGEWTPATPLENNEPCDAAEITHISEILPIARGKFGDRTGSPFSQSAIIMMESEGELKERLIDALEDRGGY